MIQKQAVDVSFAEKDCPICGQTKSINDFAIRNSVKGTRHRPCKDCHNQKFREKYKGNELQNRERNLKKKYGINESIYQMMFVTQNGCCKICVEHQSNLKHKLQVDHCHKTGRVRALLCFNCNRGLGSFGDNYKKMSAAIEYLKDYGNAE